MIVIKISGGLGNQMFQYAFSLPFISRGEIVKYDLSYYNTNIYCRSFELSKVFQEIEIKIAEPRDIFYFIKSSFDSNNKKKYELRDCRTHYIEPKDCEFSFNRELLHLANAYIVGYFQNENYFKDYYLEIMHLFKFRDIPEEDIDNFKILQLINSTKSVAVHIRRGDYLNSKFHIALPLSYYKQAINIIRSKVKNPTFFIFSDDLLYVTNYFVDEDMIIVPYNQISDSYKDLQLMSLCQHNIIANSTFSWWATWLNTNRNNITIAPKTWFRKQFDLSGLLLKDWLII